MILRRMVVPVTSREALFISEYLELHASREKKLRQGAKFLYLFSIIVSYPFCI